MPTKRKRPSAPTVRTPKQATLPHLDPEALAAAQGVRPMTQAELDAMGNVWPPDEDLDEFLAWLRQSRREGHR